MNLSKMTPGKVANSHHNPDGEKLCARPTNAASLLSMRKGVSLRAATRKLQSNASTQMVIEPCSLQSLFRDMEKKKTRKRAREERAPLKRSVAQSLA